MGILRSSDFRLRTSDSCVPRIRPEATQSNQQRLARQFRIQIPSAIVFPMLRCFGSVLLLAVIASTAFGKEKFQRSGPIHLDHGGEKWAEKTLRKLSLEEKIGQLFMIWVRAEFLNMNSPEYLQLRDQMQKYHVGSFAMTVRFEPPFLYRNQPYEAAELLNRLQRDSKLPLLVAADFERGRSEEHTSELQSRELISYAVFCLKKKK